VIDAFERMALFTSVLATLGYYLSALCHADLLTVAKLDLHPCRLTCFGVDESHVRDAHPSLTLLDTAFAIQLRNGFDVTFHHHRAFDLDLAEPGIDRDHFAAIRLTLARRIIAVVFLARDENDLVAAFDLAVYSTCLYRFHFLLDNLRSETYDLHKVLLAKFTCH